MYQHDIGRTGQASATGPSITPGALWSTQLAGGIRNQSAIAADNTVYVGAQGGLLYAVNPDGSVKWNFNTGVTFQSNVNAPAISADGSIYYGTLNGTPSSNTKGFLFAINPDGTQKWVVSSTVTGQQTGGYSAPNIAPDGTIYSANTLDGQLVALNPSGSTKFQLSLSGLGSTSIPAIGPSGTVYVSAMVSLTDRRLVAVSPTGTVLWTNTLQNRGSSSSGGNSPVTVDSLSGTIYVAADDFLSAFNPDGTTRWVLDMAGAVGASPAVSQGPVSIAPDGSLRLTDQRRLYAINSDGTLQWAVAGGFFFGSLLVDAVGKVYAYDSTLNVLKAYDASGLLKWSFAGGFTGGAAIRPDGVLIVGDFSSGQLRALGDTAPTSLSLTATSTTPAVNQQTPITATVTNAIGSPVVNVKVNFSLISGSGTLSSTAAVSNAAGQATVTFVGLTTGLYTIQASTGSLTATLNLTTIRRDLASTSWPIFQHDIGRTGQASATGPSITPGALWNTQLAGGIRNQSAIAADNTVYVGAQGGLLYAINPDSSIKWNFNTGVTFQSSLNGAAISADGTIYYGTSNGTPSSNTKGFLFAINPDGTQKWVISSTVTGQQTGGYSAPNIAPDGTIYSANTLDGQLVALNPNGSTKFQLSLSGLGSTSIPAIGPNGTVYVSALVSLTDRRLVAVSPTGTVLWTNTLQNRGTSSTGGNSPVTVDPLSGTIYVVADDFLSAFNPNGTTQWVLDMAGAVGASPTVSQTPVSIAPDGSLRLTDQQRLYALNPNGTLKWTVIGGFFFGNLLVDAAGSVYAHDSTMNALRAYDASGLLKWSFAGGFTGGAAIRPDGALIVGDFSSGQLHALQGFSASSPDQVVKLDSTLSSISITAVSTTTPDVSIALASASASGLTLVSLVYDITPSTPFSPPATITFRFDPLVVPDTTALAIYRYDGVTWSSSAVTSQIVFVAGEPRVTGSLAHSSFYALFTRDITPPQTTLLINGAPLASTTTIITSTDVIGFSATDSGIGVDKTLYAVDGSSEQVFLSTFTLSSGNHLLAFHSVDLAGNAEAVKNASISVLLFDSTPPTLALVPPGGSTVATATPTLIASYADLGRGIDPASVRLGLDGLDITTSAVVTASSASFTPTAALSQGAHTVMASVADLAGNATTFTSTFRIDSLPPVTTLLVNSLASSATSLVLISTDSLGFSATDSGVGVLETRYALDGSTAEVVFVSTFSLAAGAHTLAFRSVDRVGNSESARTVSINVQLFDATPPTLALSPVNGSTLTITTPALVATYSDLGRGVDPASVHLTLDGQNLTSSATVTASSASFTPSASLSQGTHTVTASVSDLAGNTASASSAFFIDSLPPLTTLLVNGLTAGSTNLVLASTDALSFVATDTGVGVLETRYSVDGASEAIFTASFFLSPGSHALAFHSRDRAGNMETAKTTTITVTGSSSDTTPPLVRLDFPGATGLGIEQAIGGVVNVRGAVSDASSLTWTLEAAPGAAATSGFTTIASGVGNLSGLIVAWNTASLSGYQTLRLRAADAFGNTASAAATVFVGKPVFTFAIGRKDSNVIVNKIKNPTGIAIRSDGLIWVASTADEDELILLNSSGTVIAEVDGEDGHGHGHGHGNGHDDDDYDGASFKNPQGLALDAASSLYVADKGNDRIVKLTADGSQVLLQIAKLDNHGKPKPGSGAGELRQPQDVAVDANGDIYVADSGNHRIQVFDSSGTFLRQFGPGVLLSTSEVRGIALTTEGLWVSDKEQERVFLFSRAGALIKSIGDTDSVVGEISRMRGLTSDRLGALYVVEPNRDRAQKFDPQGKGLLAFGSKAGLSQADKQAKRYLTQPIDAAVAPDGSIWITDTGRDRIVRYALPATGYSVASYTTGGGASSSSSAEPAKRVVDHSDGAKVERDDGAGVQVPKGALTADLEITVDKGDENLDKEEKTAKRKELKITAVSEEVQYGPEGSTFSAPVTLTLPYDANLIASQGMREDDLKVYYWNPTLKDWQAMPSVVDKQNKIVSALTNHFSAYQVGALGGIGVAAIDDFGFRDGYAFPNPSRNGAAVTFRMQPGSADSIEVRVYDLSGRKIHSSSDFRFLGAFDDGNGKGAQDTYDHVWDVSGVGSGVYTFVITAKKAGQSEIRKSGKVGVIK